MQLLKEVGCLDAILEFHL